MQVAKDKVVTLHYQLSEGNGEVLESNRGQIPLAYLHGHRNLLIGLEEALTGMSIGESKKVTLEPEQAYGIRKENLTQRVPVKHLLSKHKRLQPGSVVRVQTGEGPAAGTVVKVGKFMIDVDFNHPFAGKTLVFDVTVEQVRDASEEELKHGHAHGAGGHHH